MSDDQRAQDQGHEPERSRHGADDEKPFPNAEDHRKGQKPVFVNEVVRDQSLGEAANPMDLQLA